MSRMAPIVLLLVAGVVGCAASPPEPPRVEVVDLSVESVSLFEQRYRLGLRMHNPNARALEFQSLRFELAVAGHPLADGISNDDFRLPAEGERRVEVLVRSDFDALFAALGEWLRGGPSDLPYHLSGEARLAGRDEPVPFERGGKLELLQGSSEPQAPKRAIRLQRASDHPSLEPF
jgi:LEA14-like dessication related protein